jgi:hypothetical protein
VPVGCLNIVVLSPQITGRCDEVDMVIGVIIFLKLDWLKLKARQLVGSWEALSKLL